MWKTSQGNRCLMGAEALLFKAGALALVEYVKDEQSWDSSGYSIDVFDQLTWSQRLASLEFVVTHLLSSAPAAPPLNAVSEATIASIFTHISFELDLEIDDDPPAIHWRQLALSAAFECLGVDNDPEKLQQKLDLPYAANDERRHLWHPLVDSLSDQILWDRDFELIENFVDEPPEKAAMMRQIMGIDDDYFSTAADDLYSTEQVDETIERLTIVLNSP